MEILIRKCELNDVKVLRKLSIQTFSETYKEKNTKENFESHISKAFSETQLMQELQNKLSLFFFLEKNGTVVGYLKLNEGTAQTETMPPENLEVERIYLTKEMHGQGLGRLLVEKSIEVARAKNKSKIWLGVWTKNPAAIGFYEKMGFEKTGTHIFVVGDDEQMDWVMELAI